MTKGYYRINIVPCHKPWRGGENPSYTKDKKVFEAFKAVDELFNWTLPWSVLNEDDFQDYDYYEQALEEESNKFFSGTENPQYPITIIDECWVYTE